MFLKIMYEENKPDSEGSKGHKMVETSEYEFFKNGNGEYRLAYKQKDGSEHAESVIGNIYVLSDSGKTINSFHLPTI